MKTAFDTSVLVAALASWHESHDAAAEALERALGPSGGLVLPADAVLEAFAVLTRLPAPHRISPADAARLLEESLGGRGSFALTGAETWELVRRAGVEGVAGGALYDARIVTEAVKGGARRILTFNPRHFERLAPEGIAVQVPG